MILEKIVTSIYSSSLATSLRSSSLVSNKPITLKKHSWIGLPFSSDPPCFDSLIWLAACIVLQHLQTFCGLSGDALGSLQSYLSDRLEYEWDVLSFFYAPWPDSTHTHRAIIGFRAVSASEQHIGLLFITSDNSKSADIFPSSHMSGLCQLNI